MSQEPKTGRSVIGQEGTGRHGQGTVVFTLCSNNYLAQAKTLGDSCTLHNPDVLFLIGLVDRPNPGIDYETQVGYPIIPVEDLDIPGFDSLWQRYNIMELNTAVKPLYFTYLFKRFGAGVVIYFDPDIRVFGSLSPILDELSGSMGLLTPHAITPQPDAESPDGEPDFMEPAFLNHGIYNLGFLALADRGGREDFLSWWGERTARWSYIRPASGVFTDQLWMNLAPIFFPGFAISRNRGLNVAYWNLHERFLSEGPGGRLLVNGTEPLVFFHFSALDPMNPDRIAKFPVNKHTLELRPDLKGAFTDYARTLLDNGQQEFARVPCAFIEMRDRYLIERAAADKRERLREAPVAYRVKLAAKWTYRAGGNVIRRAAQALRRRLPSG